MTGILLLGSASPFNGGITQVGLGAPGYMASYETLNIFKMCQGWVYITGNGYVDPNDLDANGYPTVINSGGVYAATYIPTTTERPGIISNDYKVTWDGSGTIYCPSGTISSGNTSTSGFTFTPNTNKISIGISAGTNVTNLKVFHVDDEADILAGKTWGKQFLARLKQLKPGRIRFMDWQAGNFGNCAQWKYRKPQSFAFWAAAEPRKAVNAGSTSNSGDAYSVMFNDPFYGSGGPTDRQTIIVKWSATAAGNSPTFNLNLSGALPILPPTVNAFTGGTHTGRPGLNQWGCIVFDSGLQSWISFGSDTGSAYIDNGIPYEAMVDLCTQVGAHPHFSTPYLAADTATDLLSGAATYVRDFGPSWMKPCLEPPNETWNSQFYSTAYGDVRQALLNGGTTTYTNTVLSWTGSGSTGTSTLTFSDNAPPLGAHVTIGTYNAVTGDRILNGINGNNCYVTGVNVGGNPLKVTVNTAPTAGTSPWTGSTTIGPSASDRNNWYGRVTSLLGQSISAVFGANRAKYDFVCSVQTGSGFSSTTSSAPRIDSNSYVFAGGSAASNWVTSGCCSLYASPSELNTNQEMIDAYNLFIGGTTQAQSYVDSMGAAAAVQNNAYFLTCYQNWKSFFSARSVNKLTGYEGGYSPDYVASGGTITSPISGATQAPQCVVTMATTSWPGIGALSGPALDNTCAGLMLIPSSIGGMTQLNSTSGTCTFTNSSASITKANNFIAGQMVLFTTNNTLPTGTGFSKNKPLYVIATGLSSSAFQVSTTKGGSAIVFNTAGQLGTHTVQSGWAVISVSGNNVTLDVDSSLFTAYTAATGTMTYGNGRYMVNQLRYQGKFVTSTTSKATGLKGYTKDNINNFLAQTGGGFTAEYPSHYLLSMPSGRPDLTGDIGDGGEWGALEGVYTSLATPIFDGNMEINLGI